MTRPLALLVLLLCATAARAGDDDGKVSADELRRLNRAIEEGQVAQADGSPVSGPLEAALITRDGRTLYPVEQGIPVLMPEAAIAAGPVLGVPEGGAAPA